MTKKRQKNFKILKINIYLFTKTKNIFNQKINEIRQVHFEDLNFSFLHIFTISFLTQNIHIQYSISLFIFNSCNHSLRNWYFFFLVATQLVFDA